MKYKNLIFDLTRETYLSARVNFESWADDWNDNIPGNSARLAISMFEMLNSLYVCKDTVESCIEKTSDNSQLVRVYLDNVNHWIDETKEKFEISHNIYLLKDTQ
mgnify:CR=1 FL=1